MKNYVRGNLAMVQIYFVICVENKKKLLETKVWDSTRRRFLIALSILVLEQGSTIDQSYSKISHKYCL